MYIVENYSNILPSSSHSFFPQTCTFQNVLAPNDPLPGSVQWPYCSLWRERWMRKGLQELQGFCSVTFPFFSRRQALREPFNATSLLLTEKRKSFFCMFTDTQCRFLEGAEGHSIVETVIIGEQSWTSAGFHRWRLQTPWEERDCLHLWFEPKGVSPGFITGGNTSFCKDYYSISPSLWLQSTHPSCWRLSQSKTI